MDGQVELCRDIFDFDNRIEVNTCRCRRVKIYFEALPKALVLFYGGDLASYILLYK